MKVTEYDSKETVVTIVTKSGPVYVTQMGEGPVTFSKNEAFFETKVGNQGDVVKSKINNPLYTFGFPLQVTSPQKQLITDLINSGEEFGIWATNKGLGERFGGTMAAFEEMPEISRGTSAEDVEYSIIVFDGVVERI